jgi:protocatechuate 3,4-dioxygenase alpha subunit
MTNVKPAPLYPFKESPSQTAGPYVHIGLTPNFCGIEGVYDQDLGIAMVTDKTKGERVTVEGRVFDGAGTPLKDALVEIWQADSEWSLQYPCAEHSRGEPPTPPLRRLGTLRPLTGPPGMARFETIKPGSVPFTAMDRLQAPHINLWIVARGINHRPQHRTVFRR